MALYRYTTVRMMHVFRIATNCNTIQSLITHIAYLSMQVFCTHEDLHGKDLHQYGGLEFPQINYSKYNTRPYRYFYGCGFRHLVGDTLIKMDLHGKHMKVQFNLFLSQMFVAVAAWRKLLLSVIHVVLNVVENVTL